MSTIGKTVLTNTSIVFNGVEIGPYCAQVSLSTSADPIETTSFGSSSRTRISGLIDNSVTFSIHNNYNTIDNLFFPLVGSTAVTCVIKATSTAAASSANPSYTFSVLVTDWTPVNGAVGELATADVTFPISGAITKAIV